jgi:tRNA(Ile)-lysidine synthase
VNIVETIHETVKHHQLDQKGTRLVAGVSGGADSVALLRALKELDLPVTAAHLNHQLRGEDAEADAQFVCALADELGLPFVTKSVDVPKQAAERGVSLEMAARQARHEFFTEFGDAVIALAHHADDQAETFLLKLARGAGTHGLCGMPLFQDLGPLRIIRPMLNIPRRSIVAWLREHGHEWREDSSNRDPAFMRNRVRHTILPQLEDELNPNMRASILRTMNILQEENNWMNEVVEELYPKNAAGAVLEFSSPLPLAVRRRLLRKWLFEQGAASAQFDAVESILSQMDEGNGTTVFELSDRQRVVMEYGRLRFEAGDMPDAEFGWKITVERGTGWKKDHGRGAGILPAEASFDAGKVGDAPIEVRRVKPGDRIRPHGMQGSRKLQDLFTDQKIPRARRQGVPVVVCRGEIIWIPGYRIARGWDVHGTDAESVHVRIEQNRTE